MVSLAYPRAALRVGLAGLAMGTMPPPRAPDAALQAAEFRSQYTQRIRTGSVYTPPTWGSYGVLVAQTPRFRGHHSPYQEWCPGLAPHRTLTAAYEAGRLSWEAFAAAYLAELRGFPLILREARRRVATLLDSHRTLTLLGVVRAPDGGEGRVRCHRRLLRAWLLGLEVPGIAPCVQGGVQRECRPGTSRW